MITEAEAYDRSYGDRSEEVKNVQRLPPPARGRERFPVLARGEELRRAFVERLDRRAHDSESP